MSNGGATAAIVAAIAQAIKASGTIVRVAPEDFMVIISKSENPLVVTAKGGFLNKAYDYLTGYKGLAFFTRSANPLHLPGGCELINSKQIWIPG
ncbi:MAG TPA: hypothetical protein ENL19_00625 [candidate division WOR-3 bacterium]|uniref:Uncharacterized protein n=1 Tax=candidate division WOR-3 bacterium TaxID=2052148 RepID=A0A7C5DAJ7_UNCW3|nr:hypothetical protein [candidate division WOR-3 bacterium]